VPRKVEYGNFANNALFINDVCKICVPFEYGNIQNHTTQADKSKGLSCYIITQKIIKPKIGNWKLKTGHPKLKIGNWIV
jgi:hypothetical protein